MTTNVLAPPQGAAPVDPAGTPAGLAAPWQERVPALDGMRGIAVTLVVLGHTVGLGALLHRTPVTVAASSGWVGVDLFFVLSGYLITRILLAARTSRRYFASFYARRFLRIFPLYYAVLGGILILGTYLGARDNRCFERIYQERGWLWLYVSNIRVSMLQSMDHFGGRCWVEFSHFWSLAVEEQYYIVWPLLVRFVPTRALRWVLVGMIVLGPATRWYFLAQGNVPGAAFFTLSRVDALAAGGLLAVLQLDYGVEKLKRYARWTTLPLIAGIAGLVVWRGNYANVDEYVLRYGYTLNALLFANLIVLMLGVPASHWSCRALTWPALSRIGTYSYAIYIFHFMIAKPFFQYVLNYKTLEERFGSFHLGLFVEFAAVFSLSVVAAAVSWHGFESRILALKRHFPYVDGGAVPAGRPLVK